MLAVGCACDSYSVGAVTMDRRGLRPGVLTGALPVGAGTAADCNAYGGQGAAPMPGESAAEYEARSLRCLEFNQAVLAREAQAEADADALLYQGGARVLDEVLDRWIGEDEPRRAPAAAPMSTGKVVAIVAGTVGGLTVLGLVLRAAMAAK